MIIQSGHILGVVSSFFIEGPQFSDCRSFRFCKMDSKESIQKVLHFNFLILLSGSLSRCLERSLSGFTDLGFISDQGKILNVPIFYHEYGTPYYILMLRG